MRDNTQRDNLDAVIEFIEVDMNEFAKPDALEVQTGSVTEAGEPKPEKDGTKPENDAAKPEEASGGKRVARELFSYLIIVVTAVFIAVVISKFVIINAHIPSTSMIPTLKVDDRLIGFRLAYLFSEPKRGDVVIFEHSFSEDSEKEILVKRIIGIPGDEILIENGQVYLNGELLEEDYLQAPMNVLSASRYVVPEDSYFVMGDNRNVSYDSRMWANTYVLREEIVARVLFKYYPRLEKIE